MAEGAYTDLSIEPGEDPVSQTILSDAPPRQYPSGLCLCLDGQTLKALSFEPADMPEVGDVLHFSAFAKVTSYTASDGEYGANCSISLQITDMSVIENESDEDPGDDAKEGEV